MALVGAPTSTASIAEYQEWYKRQFFRVLRGEGPPPQDLNTWADTAQVDAYNGVAPRVQLGPSPTAAADVQNYLAGYESPFKYGTRPVEANDQPNNPLFWFTEGEIDYFVKAPKRQTAAITKYEPPPVTPPIYTGNTGIYYGGTPPYYGGGIGYGGLGGVPGASLASLLALARLYNSGSNGKRSKKKQGRRSYSY